MQTPQRPPNFRDLAGIPVADGRRVKAARLLRGGEMSGLSNEDKQILLNEYKLATVVDLRGKDEIKKTPDELPEGVAYINLDIMKEEANQSSSLENMERFTAAEKMDNYLQNCYRLMVEDKEARQEFRYLVDALLKQQEGALLFHCYAGKDRTGMSAAIILTLLGAIRESINEDYLRTNEMRKEENQRTLALFKEQGATQSQLEAIEMGLLVKPSFIQTAYDVADKVYGSFSNYVYEGIGVTKQEAEQLRAMYLV